MEKIEIIVTLSGCAVGFLAAYFSTASSAHPKKWVRIAKFLPMVGFVATGMGIVALQRPSFMTLWILTGTYVISMLAEYIDTALMARTTTEAWELFKLRLRHWPYVVTLAMVMLIAGLFMSPRQHAKTESVSREQYTETKKQLDETWRGIDSARNTPLTPARK